MKQFSIVIPVFNEDRQIGELLNSLQKVDYPVDCFEIIVVNDGSTDQTAQVVQRYGDVRLVDLPENVGRYYARKAGAEAARNQGILFVDSRTVIDPAVLSVLAGVDAKAVNGNAVGATKPGAFETFYQAIRRLVFPDFYKVNGKPFFLTVDNFDRMQKGTTIFYIEKEVLMEVFSDLSASEMGKHSSDDTKFLRTILNRTPILVHPDVKTKYIARTAFGASIRHLYERGPRFVDYYFDPTKKNFWLVIVIPFAMVLGLVCGLVFAPGSSLQKFAVLAGLDILIAGILARTVEEFIKILYITPVCLTVFYLGILRGIIRKLRVPRKRAGNI
jgi:glycosyltransferase involved in cell wall biosynthesis